MKGLVDHPAIGIGSGYQYFLSGGPATPPGPKVALACLRRRFGVGALLLAWLDQATAELSSSHPAHAEIVEIKEQYTALNAYERARLQVAQCYKQSVDLLNLA